MCEIFSDAQKTVKKTNNSWIERKTIEFHRKSENIDTFLCLYIFIFTLNIASEKIKYNLSHSQRPEK